MWMACMNRVSQTMKIILWKSKKKTFLIVCLSVPFWILNFIWEKVFWKCVFFFHRLNNAASTNSFNSLLDNVSLEASNNFDDNYTTNQNEDNISISSSRTYVKVNWVIWFYFKLKLQYLKIFARNSFWLINPWYLLKDSMPWLS